MLPVSKTESTAFPVARGKRQDLLKVNGICDIELAGDGPCAGGEMRAATELLAEIMREAAHVGSFGAGHAELAKGSW